MLAITKRLDGQEPAKKDVNTFGMFLYPSNKRNIKERVAISSSNSSIFLKKFLKSFIYPIYNKTSIPILDRTKYF